MSFLDCKIDLNWSEMESLLDKFIGINTKNISSINLTRTRDITGLSIHNHPMYRDFEVLSIEVLNVD